MALLCQGEFEHAPAVSDLLFGQRKPEWRAQDRRPRRSEGLRDVSPLAKAHEAERAVPMSGRCG
jgi:hypothetical protein